MDHVFYLKVTKSNSSPALGIREADLTGSTMVSIVTKLTEQRLNSVLTRFIK